MVQCCRCRAARPHEWFGFITTNNLKQTFNRQVMQPFLEGDPAPLTLIYAVPDHPWVDSGDGATVRIAMTVAERTPPVVVPGQLLSVIAELSTEGDNASEVILCLPAVLWVKEKEKGGVSFPRYGAFEPV